MLKELEKRVKLFDGIHCVIGDRYCSYDEEGYIDEFYINSISNNDIEIYYDRETYKYISFDEMINAKIFNGKSINEMKNSIYLEDL